MEDFKGCKVHWFYGDFRTGANRTHALFESIRNLNVKYKEIFNACIKLRGCYYLDDAKNKNIKVVYIDGLCKQHDSDNSITIRDITNFINGSYIKIKGEGYVYMQPEELYITSIHKPEELYQAFPGKEDKGYKNLIDHIVELREFKIDEYKEHIEYENLINEAIKEYEKLKEKN